MSPSLDGTMPESVISQENNPPLTLYITLKTIFFSSWISIVLLIKFNKICKQIILALTYLSIKVERKCIFMKSEHFLKCMYSCNIRDTSTVPPERVAYRKLTRTLKNHSSSLHYPNLSKILLFDFEIISHSLNLHKCLWKLLL